MAAVAEAAVQRPRRARIAVLCTRVLSPAVGASFVLASMGVTSVRQKTTSFSAQLYKLYKTRQLRKEGVDLYSAFMLMGWS